MKIRYFEDTDTLYIQLNNKEITRTESVTENILFDLDESGKIVALTIEHAEASQESVEFIYKKAAA